MIFIIKAFDGNDKKIEEWINKSEERRKANPGAVTVNPIEYTVFLTEENEPFYLLRIGFFLPNIIPRAFFKMIIRKSLKIEGVSVNFYKPEKIIELLIAEGLPK